MMTDYQKLERSLSKVIWGYVFLYFNININQVSLLPDFVGYLLFLSAIEGLKEEERELTLLKTLGVILAIWDAVAWATSWVSVEIGGRWLFADLLISVINIYFQFQFVTNLAAIAERHQTGEDDLHGKMLKYRTWQTVILTVVTIVTELLTPELTAWAYLSILMMLVYLILAFCLIKAIVDLRRCVRARDGEPLGPRSGDEAGTAPETKEETEAESGAQDAQEAAQHPAE